jgi:hypothetical protein
MSFKKNHIYFRTTPHMERCPWSFSSCPCTTSDWRVTKQNVNLSMILICPLQEVQLEIWSFKGAMCEYSISLTCVCKM